MKNKIEEMLRINEQQRAYYEQASGSDKSSLNSTTTNLWRHLRKRLFSPFREANVQETISKLHQKWLGDIKGMKVLDLGVGSGNPLSLELAKNAQKYVAIDLSHTRIKAFRNKLETAGIYNVKLFTEDFLSDKFQEKDFNVIYAMAIMHHFCNIDAFLRELHKRMTSNGIVITLDPIQTWFPARVIRTLYRPFQTDASWEHPFTRSTLEATKRYFVIERVQGLYGKSKWALGFSILLPELAKMKAQIWHEHDLKKATKLDVIRSCLQVSFLLRKK